MDAELEEIEDENGSEGLKSSRKTDVILRREIKVNDQKIVDLTIYDHKVVSKGKTIGRTKHRYGIISVIVTIKDR